MGLTTSSNANIFEGLGVGFSVGTAGFYAEGEEKTDNQKTGEDMAKDGGAFQHDVGSIILEYTAGPITIGPLPIISIDFISLFFGMVFYINVVRIYMI